MPLLSPTGSQAAEPATDTTEHNRYPQALSGDSTELTLWAESPEEARQFLSRAAQSAFAARIERIFVAKRSPTQRHNSYIGGLYYRTTDDENVDAYKDVVVAPDTVTQLVQWCTCDVMLSRGSVPLLALEDTTHIVRMNLYQRIPRLARAASLGVPAAVLQGTRGLDFRLRGDRWGLFRYLQAFAAIAQVHPLSPALPFWYDPTTAAERQAQDDAFRFVNAALVADLSEIERQRTTVMARVRAITGGREIPPDLPSIVYSGRDVIVRIGAKPEKKSWREKGSGQMDPYLGLILAAKYIYCYDGNGQKVKDLVLEFTYLPQGFWFFSNPETTALYKRLPLEFADRVRFLG